MWVREQEPVSSPLPLNSIGSQSNKSIDVFFLPEDEGEGDQIKKRQSKNCNWKEALHKVDLHEVVKRAEIPFLCALDGVHSGVAK